MTITYVPFESKSGFKSPNFSVSATGDLIAANISVDNITSTSVEVATLIASTATIADILSTNIITD